MARPGPRRGLFLLLALWLAHGAWAGDPAPRLVIIIDDLGYQLAAGSRAAALPGKVNLAILPQTPSGAAVARLGLAAGKEILLHAPMSNTVDKPLGDGALTAGMTEQQLRRMLVANLESTPGVRGVNNHMGSLLTARRQPMEWVMDELASRGMYYVDSRTTAATLAAGIAAERGVPHLSRNVFLDNHVESRAIDRKFRELLTLADREGIAVAIGHPHDATLDYLQRELPLAEARGYRLSLISEILAPQFAQTGSPPAGSD